MKANAKKISLPTGRGMAKRNVALPSGETYLYNIADFLQDVKGIFDDTFSLDVHKHLGTGRNSNTFSQNLHQLRDTDRQAQQGKASTRRSRSTM